MKTFLEILRESNSLGSLSAKYESENRGSEAIGYDSAGGTSYGKYQLSSKKGRVNEFIKFLEKKGEKDLAQRLAKNQPADTGSKTGKMPEEWKKIAGEGLFKNYEHDYIKETHYDIALRNLKPELKNIVNKNSTLQNILWSTAVQHGPENNIFNSVFKPGMNVGDFITAIYEERCTKFNHLKSSERVAVINRFKQEVNDARGEIGLEPVQLTANTGNGGAAIAGAAVLSLPMWAPVAGKIIAQGSTILAKFGVKLPGSGIADFMGDLIQGFSEFFEGDQNPEHSLPDKFIQMDVQSIVARAKQQNDQYSQQVLAQLQTLSKLQETHLLEENEWPRGSLGSSGLWVPFTIEDFPHYKQNIESYPEGSKERLRAEADFNQYIMSLNANAERQLRMMPLTPRARGSRSNVGTPAERIAHVKKIVQSNTLPPVSNQLNGSFVANAEETKGLRTGAMIYTGITVGLLTYPLWAPFAKKILAKGLKILIKYAIKLARKKLNDMISELAEMIKSFFDNNSETQIISPASLIELDIQNIIARANNETSPYAMQVMQQLKPFYQMENKQTIEENNAA